MTIKFSSIILFLIVFTISAISIFCLITTTDFSFSFSNFVFKQIIFLIFAMIIFFIVQKINYTTLIRYSLEIYIATIILLGLVFFIGKTVFGSTRWLELGPVYIQPSEFAKIGVVLLLGKLLMYEDKIEKLSGLILPFIVVVTPMIMVMKQPDLGSALVFFPVFLVMTFVAGTRVRYIIILFLVIMITTPLTYKFLLKEYQQRRISAFINPAKLSMEEGYQLIQSKVAIGTGGIVGKIWSESDESYTRFVPKRHNDFIFSIIGEKLGFVGSTIILMLYCILILYSLGVAIIVREPFGRLVISGFVSIFAIQVFVNVGMTIGLTPITGITLPFVSYGGSSLVSSFIMLGIISNIGKLHLPTFSSRDFEFKTFEIPSAGIDEKK